MTEPTPGREHRDEDANTRLQFLEVAQGLFLVAELQKNIDRLHELLNLAKTDRLRGQIKRAVDQLEAFQAVGREVQEDQDIESSIRFGDSGRDS